MVKTLLIAALTLLAVQGARGASAPLEAAPGAIPGPYESATPLTTQNPIDKLVFGRLRQLGLEPARLCSDAVFVRRVYLDVIGTLPTAPEARAFLADPSPDKRRVLIDHLLQRPEFADYWAMKWSDLLRVKAEFPINLWPNAVQTYHRWIQTSLRENKPYDQFVREMLTASGSNFRVPEVNFYRAIQGRDAQSIAKAVALTFMGARAEKWPREQWAGLAAFFAQTGFKSTSEWKEEIIFFDANKPTSATALFPDGTKARLTGARDPREIFADWLITPKNPWFTRNIANRVWSWLLGRGVIQEPDDIRPDNPPSNPELLTLLERALVADHYNLKAVYRLILNSQTYQLASIPRSRDPRAEANFAYYPLRRLEAEVLIDALDQITGTTEKYSSPIPEPFTYIPEAQRSIALADGSITSPFLEMFGRPPRDTGWESERNNRPTADQRLHMLNSSHIQRKIELGQNLQAMFNMGGGQPRQLVNTVYLTILSRYPTEDELQAMTAYAQTMAGNRRAVAVDLVWALINSAEFLYRH